MEASRFQVRSKHEFSSLGVTMPQGDRVLAIRDLERR